MRGRLIVLEGIDGCGSTTQARMLVERLLGAGVVATGTREPSGGPVGRLIREALTRRLTGEGGEPRPFDWATMALLFAADRADHVRYEVQPALDAGITVVSDRYDLSSMVYQSLTADRDGALPWLRALGAWAPRPDLTVIVDVAAEVAEGRRARRGGVVELFETRRLQERLAEAYRRAGDFLPDDAIAVLDGGGGPQEVADSVWAAVSRALDGAREEAG